MKFRTGFVSNSSSSSFIIALERLPESVEEMHEWLFPEGPRMINYVEGIPSLQLAACAFQDLSDDSRLTHDQMTERLTQGTVYCSVPGIEWPEYDWVPGLSSEEHKLRDDKHEKALKEAAGKLASTMIGQNPKAEFHCVEYSDNEGVLNATMEHGGVFDNLPHQRISHH